MKNSKLIPNITSLLLFFTLLGLANLSNQKETKPTIFISKQQSTINLKENFWTYLHVGQKRLFSSLLWIATILESDHDHYKEKDLNSWMFLRFNMMAKLEPKFLENYNFGGPYLSIIKDDLPGASSLFKKGLKIYPNDQRLLKSSFFHFYYEIGDYDQSAKILESIKIHHKLDPLMLSAFARIQSSEGKQEDAFELIKSNYMLLKNNNPFVATRLYQYLYSIKAEVDLNCLNQLNRNEQNCSKVDLNENLYIKDASGKYKAQKEWIPFRPKRKISPTELAK